ncbi:MAG: DUF1565 domain-containing protein, partial [Planctomycetes bacterium]|nr:DUF1565 domain-containing protein [Planctomycetota bacterium]
MATDGARALRLGAEREEKMRTRMLAVSTVVLFWAAGSVCLAADACLPGEIELYPTYTAVGIEIPYSGDDNGDATAEFVWRKSGEENWQDGVDMTIDRERRLVWASIWPLDEGETIEVKVAFNDPQTPDLLPLTASATTKRMILENAGGQKWFVAPEGNDADAGTEDKPFGTIAHAVSAAKPGDTVVVSSGVYREGDLGKGVIGESDKPIIITAAKGAKPVIDGSVEIAKGSDGWTKLEGDIYARDFSPETGYCGYVAQDGLRMFWYKKGVDFKNDSLKAKRGCYFEETLKKLYVRTGDSSSPSDHTYNIAVYPYGLHLSGSRYVTVKGFDIRFFGEAAVRVSDGARGSVVAGNRIHNAPAGILVLDEATCETAIWRNEIYEEGLTDFTWTAVKRSNYARQGTRIMAGRGTSVCYN